MSSFGHLEHPRPQKVLISAVGRRVTPTASRQEEGNAAAQQQRAAQLHCHSGGFKHCQSVSRSAKPTRPAFLVERRFTRCLALWLVYLKFPLQRLFIKLNDKKKNPSTKELVLRSRAIARVLAASGLAASSQTWWWCCYAVGETTPNRRFGVYDLHGENTITNKSLKLILGLFFQRPSSHQIHRRKDEAG